MSKINGFIFKERVRFIQPLEQDQIIENAQGTRCGKYIKAKVETVEGAKMVIFVCFDVKIRRVIPHIGLDFFLSVIQF